jgi:hypothetical protein
LVSMFGFAMVAKGAAIFGSVRDTTPVMRLQHRLSPLVFVISVLVGQPRSVRAAEPEPEPVIDIEVDAADLPATRAELANIVSTEVNRALAGQDSLPAGVFVADDRRVLVELHPSPIPGSDEVLIHVEVQLGGERLAESTTETCLSCTDAGVADKVLLLLTPLLPKLPAPMAPAAPAPAIEEHEAETLNTRRPPARRELLISGGVLLGAGVVGLGVGIGLFVLDERLVSPPNALEFEVIKYREPGIATMVIGSAATVTGAVLLALALHHRRRAHVAAAPIPGPHAVGVLFSGRF